MRYPAIREKANQISNKISDIPDASRLSRHRKRILDAYDKTLMLYWELEEECGDRTLFEVRNNFQRRMSNYLFNLTIKEAKYFILRELNIIACYESKDISVH
jgi:hypothetical protein